MQRQEQQTRAQKEGTSWLKIIAIVIAVLVGLALLWILLFGFLLGKLAGDAQQADRQPTTTQATSSVSDVSTNTVPDHWKRTEMNQLRAAIELYKRKNGEYPQNLSVLENTDIMSSFPDNPEVYSYNIINNSDNFCLGTCMAESSNRIRNNKQCISELELSCEADRQHTLDSSRPG